MKRWVRGCLMVLGVALLYAPKPARALVGTSINIFGFNYNITMKSYNTDANGNPTGTCTWVLMGTGSGMDFLVVDGPAFP